MDWVTLTRDEVEEDALPPVCMECGGPAAHRVNRTFVKDPEWVATAEVVGFIAGVLPGMVIDSLARKYLRRQIRVSCPFCDDHRGHWTKPWRDAARWGAAVGGAGAVVGFLIAAGLDPGTAEQILGASIGGVIGLIVGATAAGLWTASTRITATDVDPASVRLEHLGDRFVRAVKAMRKIP